MRRKINKTQATLAFIYKDIGDIAPILKPREIEEFTDQIIENEDKLTVEDLVSIAPFIDQDYLDKLVDKINVVENMRSLCGLAPFISEQALDKLAEKLQKRGKLFQLTGLAPFLSELRIYQKRKKFVESDNCCIIESLV